MLDCKGWNQVSLGHNYIPNVQFSAWFAMIRDDDNEDDNDEMTAMVIILQVVIIVIIIVYLVSFRFCAK